MGLIDFVKDAGESLLGSRASADTGAQSSAQPAGSSAAAQPDLGPVLEKSVKLLEIPVENLVVDVRGDTAVVSGLSPTQADRERLVLVVGNTKGIAQVDDRLTVKTPEPEATMYTVKKGDSLSKIAKAHYGDPMKYPAIFDANKPMLSDPDKIYPGQVLRLPPQ